MSTASEAFDLPQPDARSGGVKRGEKSEATIPTSDIYLRTRNHLLKYGKCIIRSSGPVTNDEGDLVWRTLDARRETLIARHPFDRAHPYVYFRGKVACNNSDIVLGSIEAIYAATTHSMLNDPTNLCDAEVHFIVSEGGAIWAQETGLQVVGGADSEVGQLLDAVELGRDLHDYLRSEAYAQQLAASLSVDNRGGYV